MCEVCREARAHLVVSGGARTKAHEDLELRLGLDGCLVAIERLGVCGTGARKHAKHEQSEDQPNDNGGGYTDILADQVVASLAGGRTAAVCGDVVDTVGHILAQPAERAIERGSTVGAAVDAATAARGAVVANGRGAVLSGVGTATNIERCSGGPPVAWAEGQRFHGRPLLCAARADAALLAVGLVGASDQRVVKMLDVALALFAA